jgi:hypothetical protein
MQLQARARDCVMGHDGRRLTLSDLPTPNTKRWVIRRKAEVVAAVRGGLISLEDACNLYSIGLDEFKTWEFCIDCYGIAGLRVTQAQMYLTSMGRIRRLRKRPPRYLETMSCLSNLSARSSREPSVQLTLSD